MFPYCRIIARPREQDHISGRGWERHCLCHLLVGHVGAGVGPLNASPKKNKKTKERRLGFPFPTTSLVFSFFSSSIPFFFVTFCCLFVSSSVLIYWMINPFCLFLFIHFFVIVHPSTSFFFFVLTFILSILGDWRRIGRRKNKKEERRKKEEETRERRKKGRSGMIDNA